VKRVVLIKQLSNTKKVPANNGVKLTAYRRDSVRREVACSF
jgi:hypothetical protein